MNSTMEGSLSRAEEARKQFGAVRELSKDEETIETLKQIHTELELDLEGPYNATPEPEDIEGTAQPEPWDLEQIFDRVILFAGKLSKRFRKPKKVVEEAPQAPSVKPGGEIAQELTDAWNLYTRGAEEIPSKHVGYVLRILGQNPTEDDIVAMVMKADCDWDGVMNRTDFLGVGQEILKNSCDQMDDVKAAFRVFDSNDNGSISKEELREAMVNLGQRCTEEEFSTMFATADKNRNGRIDFDEFVEMMLPPNANPMDAPT